MGKILSLNTKITTLSVKFQQMISAIKKPFLIILHSLDNVEEENLSLIVDCFSKVIDEENIKLIISTKALKTDLIPNHQEDRKIFLKALTTKYFEEYLKANNINLAKKTLEDFYKYSRGYYYYTALTIKIIQSMNIDINEFLQKFAKSGMTFNSYIGFTYMNLIPTTIRNFFLFLKTIRHGITLNALAVLELYDEFSIEYLKTNLMVFQVNETLYVQDYFYQKINMDIPTKTKIKLHKYIIGIYEKQLKESLKDRVFLISRQAMRAEIEYHNECIEKLKNGEIETAKIENQEEENLKQEQSKDSSEPIVEETFESKFKEAIQFANDKKYTNAIEILKNLVSSESIDLATLIESRLHLARYYKEINRYPNAEYYYHLVEVYYQKHNEVINLNYLYYEMTDLFNKMYKNERAVETIKKVIYSVETPQSLMLSACTLLGNIYSDMNLPQEAYSYYKKALESKNDNIETNVLAELYFKYALANDDKGDVDIALEYYTKCIAISEENDYKALAYSNLASCYFDNGNLDDAKNCYKKAYKIEKSKNNYDGIYYNSYNLAKIYLKENSQKAYNYLLEAKQSAEFINEPFYILESSIAMGDFYYNDTLTYDKSLIEYFKAKNIALNMSETIDMSRIEKRITDMKLRMTSEQFKEIENKYDKRNKN
jgi:tetratricopeptide (TPR) repeat protein